MAPVTGGRDVGLVMLAGATLYLLATAAFSVTPAVRSHAHPSAPPSHARPLKRTWRTGPASMPLETEVVPPHPSPVPPTVRPQTLSALEEQTAKVGEVPPRKPTGSSTLVATRLSTTQVKSKEKEPARKPSADLNLITTGISAAPVKSEGQESAWKHFAGSNLAVTRTPAAPVKSAVTTIDESDHHSNYLDPEKRAHDDLTRLRANPDARQAFYENLRHTVERVRAGEKDQITNEN